METNKRMRIVKIDRDQCIVDEVYTFKAIFGLWDQFAPVRTLRFGDIDRDDTASRRILVGAKQKGFADVVNKGVVGVKIVEEFDNFGVRRLEILIENAVPRVSALPDSY